MDWTEEQKDSIEIRDTDLLVSASAGAGKTAVLVERIKRQIIEEGADVTDFLVVTFTNAAASEMKAKIREALLKEMEDHGEKRVFLKKQINDLHRAQISTFHSFAAKIVGEYFHILRLEPGLKFCDEAEAELLMSGAMEATFAEFFAEDHKGFTDFLKSYSSPKSDKTIKKDLIELYKAIRNMPDYWESFSAMIDDVRSGRNDDAEKYMLARLLKLAEKAYRQFGAAAEKAEEYGFEEREHILEEGEKVKSLLYAGSIEEYGKILENIEFSSLRFTGYAKYKETISGKGSTKEEYESRKGEVQALRNNGKSLITGKRSEYISEVGPTEDGHMRDELGDRGETVKEILISLENHYRDLKKERKVMDFSDSEHYALEILKNDHVRREIREKYKYILVDEYQDSNYLQESMIKAISSGNNVFMVGDLKQSIYGFRMAEPDIFKEKYEKYSHGEEGRTIDLNSNFRSKNGIIGFVNRVFSDLMEGYEKGALKLGVENENDISYSPKLYLIETGNREGAPREDDPADRKEKPGKVETEAELAAGIIGDSIGKVEIYDRKNGLRRPLEKRDIAILLRTFKGRGEKYYEALMNKGIDAYVDDNSGYFDKMEVSTFTDLLRVIDNEKRDIPLLSVLRSGIFGFTVNELAEIKIGTDKGAFHERFRSYGENGQDEILREKIDRTLKRIRDWKEDARVTAVSRLIWKLMEDTGYYLYAGALPGGDQRQANLRTYADRAAAFEKKGDSSLGGFLRYIEMLIEKDDIKIPQTKMVSEGMDAVRIMSIHKSKGLEFPMVLLCDAGREKQGRRDKANWWDLDKDLGFGMTYVDIREKWKADTAVKRAIKIKKTEREQREEERILYVALTRACDDLRILATVDSEDKLRSSFEKKTLVEMVYDAFNREDIIRHRAEDIWKTTPENEYTDMGSEKGDIFTDAAKPDISDEVCRRLDYKYPYEEQLVQKSKVSVSELSGKGKVREQLKVPVFIEEKVKTGAELGTLVHLVMEHIPFRKMCDSPEQTLGSTLEQMVEDKIIDETQRSMVDAGKIRGFFSTEIGKQAVSADMTGNLHKEKRFTMLHEEDGENMMVQGIIDCYFETDQGIVLIDFKTDKDTSNMTEKYGKQIRLYAEALRKATGREVKSAYLYLFENGTAEKVI